MNARRVPHLRISLLATLALSFIALPLTNATGAVVHAKNTTTFVGGDIHTLTFTKAGLFVTGHEAGSLSTDGGMKWKSVPSFQNVDVMAWATTSLGYLAGGHTGLLKSNDGGKNFQRYNFYGKVSDVHSLGAAGKTVYIGSPQVGFLRSADSGKSWKLVNAKIGEGFMGSMLVDPSNVLRVIAPDMTNGLVQTTDSGKTWALFGGPKGVMSVDWNPKNHKEIVALTMGSGALTKDNGKTWSTFSLPMGASAIAFSPTGSKICVAVLAGNRAGIITSLDSGKTWI